MSIADVKNQISEVILETMMGIREGVGKCRNEEFSAFIKDLIAAKEAGLDVGTLPLPMLTDHVKQGVEAFLSVKKDLSVSGGLIYSIVTVDGKYGKEEQTAMKINVAMEFFSAGSLDLGKVVEMNPEELTKLLEVVNANA